jgi:hypothetical protein
MNNKKTTAARNRFSKEYETFNEWRVDNPGDTPYTRNILRGHLLHPDASLSELRRHPSGKKSEEPLRKKPKRPFEERIRDDQPHLTDAERNKMARILSVVKRLRTSEATFTEACRDSGIRPDVVKRSGVVYKQNRKWYPEQDDDLSRHTNFWSSGGMASIRVKGSRRASLIGKYMAYVGLALESKDPGFLKDFRGRGVKDVNGKWWPFETRLSILQDLNDAVEGEELEFEVSGA